MNARRPLPILSLLALALMPATAAFAQCTNQTQYPSIAITPDPGGALTTISTCSFTVEYSRVTSIVAGATYQFTIDGGNYITVHQGTFDGPVLGFGPSPVTVTAATGEDLFPTWTNDASCTGQTNCQVTTVQLFLNCTPPQYTITTTNDCANSQFYVNVTLLNTGDAGSIGFSYTVDNGPVNLQPGNVAGSYVLGPFPNLSLIDLTLQHDSDPACNQTTNDITNYPCAIISCGPDTYTHCYSNNEEYIRVFQGNSTFPLRMQFNSGGIYQFGGDVLTIYDGLNDAAPILYQGLGNAGDLSGLFWTSTNLDYALTIKLTTDGFTSCSDGGVAGEWNYTVGCLDCVPGQATAGNVSTDCALQEFTVQVNVTDLGSDPQAEIGNDAGVPPTVVTAPGTYTAGPFPVGNEVTLSLVNDANALCNVQLGTFENSYCPIQITCGEPAFEAAYCYLNNDSQFWLYQNTGTESLALLFGQGTIENPVWDDLRIYDGVDNSAPLLWEHLSGGTFDLTGLLVISTGPAIYMEMTSDGSVSCSSGQMTEWQWTVGCLDCTQPDADYDVQLDCANAQFYINTTITEVGSDPSVEITNTGGAPAVTVTAPGTYTSGPFAFGSSVQMEVVNDINTLCSVSSPFITNPPCPYVSCGPDQYTYCYPNAADTAMVYQSANTFPIAMIFNAGQMSTFGDSIYVYDGPDYQSPVVFSGANGGDLTGLLFTSTNTDNALMLRIRSNFYSSCQDNLYTPMDWNVSCLDCTNPVATFELVPDCVHNGFNIAANVTSTGTSPTLRIVNSWNGDTLSNVGVGTTLIGPIPVDSIAHLTVLNSQNPLCRIVSPDFTYASDSCINVACVPTGVEYCYTNADTAYFTYTSGTTDAITLSFGYGQLLVNDYIQIYNGLDTTAQMVYMGNQGGQIGGLAISSNNADNALTLLVISSQAGSCATGQGFPPLYWTVGCGLVGISEVENGDFQLFPNPTNGELYIRLPDAESGAVRMEVMDVTGRLVRSEQFNAASGTNAQFDMSELQSGNYIVVLSTDTWRKSRSLQLVH